MNLLQNEASQPTQPARPAQQAQPARPARPAQPAQTVGDEYLGQYEIAGLQAVGPHVLEGEFKMLVAEGEDPWYQAIVPAKNDRKPGYPDALAMDQYLELVVLFEFSVNRGTVKVSDSMIGRINEEMDPEYDELFKEDELEFQFVLAALVDEGGLFKEELKTTKVFNHQFKGKVQLWAYLLHEGSGQSFDLDLSIQSS